jgi:MarR family transcriptional regulator, 2-MHQ and catechol-resistance regulon repressor
MSKASPIQPAPRTAAPAAALEPALAADARALNDAVSDLVRIYQFRDRDRICCYDISVTQCYALEALVERGALRSSALSEVLMLDRSTTTRVIDALVRKGYVVRSVDVEDRRAVSLRATAAGQRLLSRIQAGLIEQHAELLRDVAPEARALTIDVIRRLARSAGSRFAYGFSVGCNDDCATGTCS